MKSKAHSREMLMALPGDREWESQLAVDTNENKAYSREMFMALPGDSSSEVCFYMCPRPTDSPTLDPLAVP